MVAISIDYRSQSRQDVFPQDCVRILQGKQQVRAHSERLGIDPNRIAAGGGSAGGHLAAATALLPGFEDGDFPDISSMPNALLLFNPAVILAKVADHDDLIDSEKLADIAERTDGRPQEVSPYHFVRSGLPPTIIFHGTQDEAVPFATVQLFQKTMTEAGNRCELKAYENQPHGFFNPGRGKGAPRTEATRQHYEDDQTARSVSGVAWLSAT
ncbi:MAG: alpha/beta hydrolase [Planctomycetaceae bacterium]